MLLRLGFDQCCEIIGRASAIIAIAGMASLVFAATAVDVFANRPDIDVTPVPWAVSVIACMWVSNPISLASTFKR